MFELKQMEAIDSDEFKGIFFFFIWVPKNNAHTNWI